MSLFESLFSEGRYLSLISPVDCSARTECRIQGASNQHCASWVRLLPAHEKLYTYVTQTSASLKDFALEHRLGYVQSCLAQFSLSSIFPLQIWLPSAGLGAELNFDNFAVHLSCEFNFFGPCAVLTVNMTWFDKIFLYFLKGVFVTSLQY